LVVANDFQNRDLFWALRGGGGGTFGVVVSVTLKTFPEPPVILQTQIATFPDLASLWVFSESYLKTLPAIADAGGSGYYYIDPHGLILRNGKPSFIVLHFFFNKTDTKAIQTLFEPLYKLADSLNASKIARYVLPVLQARNVLPKPGDIDPSGHNTVIGTRLYSRRNLETENGPANLVSAFTKITTLVPTIIEGHLTAGGQVARNADLIDSALNPSWRKALGQIIVPIGWIDDTPVEIQEQLTQILTDVLMPQIAAVDLDMGAYMNEANPYEPDWQKVFWGENYPRLLEIKNKWDPRGLFRCNRCVGSERWDASGNCPSRR
jgi:hypothetical protein